MHWYYADGEEPTGPLSDTEFRAAVFSGKVKGGTLVWNETMPEWVALETLPPVRGARRASALRMAPSSPPADAALVDPKPADSSVPAAAVLERPGTPGDFMFYGGFWIRLAAKALDLAILGAVWFGISVVGGIAIAMLAASGKNPMSLVGIQLTMLSAQMLVAVLYNVLFVGKCGATPGKLVCRLRVVLPDGTPIGYVRALGRCFSEVLSVLVLCLGYLMAAFDEEKRTLHDRICGTRVIRT